MKNASSSIVWENNLILKLNSVKWKLDYISFKTIFKYSSINLNL